MKLSSPGFSKGDMMLSLFPDFNFEFLKYVSSAKEKNF